MAMDSRKIPNLSTRTGDTGDTSLWSGERVRKSDLRIVANGEIDFALSALGCCHGHLNTVDDLAMWIRTELLAVQERFVALMGEIATSEAGRDRFAERVELINGQDVERVDRLGEQLRDDLNRRGVRMGRWQNYGAGGAAAAEFYFARACFRRAELSLWHLVDAGYSVRAPILQLVNRMSDVLFLVALFLEKPAESAGNG